MVSSRWEEAWEAATEALARRKTPDRSLPGINWVLAEQLYVHGELVEAGDAMVRVYPTFKAIGERCGTSKENVTGRAARYNWRELRRDAKLDRMANRTDDRINRKTRALDVAVDVTGDTSRKKKRRSPEETLLDYLDLCDTQLQLGRIKADTVGDIDKAIRTLAFVRGQADSRREVRTTVSLEVLQAKHASYRVTASPSDEDLVAGVLGTGGGPAILEAEGVPSEVAAIDGEGRAYNKRDGSRAG
jgi:hypothetical protein